MGNKHNEILIRLTALEENKKPIVKYLSCPRSWEKKKQKSQTISIVAKYVDENSYILMESV